MIQLLAAMLGTLAFSILFSAPRGHWLFCSFVGGIGWLVNTLLIAAGMGSTPACCLATLSLTFLSRLLSVWRRSPSTVFLIAGIFPLVPGAGIYYTAYYLFNSDFTTGLAKGVETLKISGAITLGILFGFALPPRLFSWAGRSKHESK